MVAPATGNDSIRAFDAVYKNFADAFNMGVREIKMDRTGFRLLVEKLRMSGACDQITSDSFQFYGIKVEQLPPRLCKDCKYFSGSAAKCMHPSAEQVDLVNGGKAHLDAAEMRRREECMSSGRLFEPRAAPRKRDDYGAF